MAKAGKKETAKKDVKKTASKKAESKGKAPKAEAKKAAKKETPVKEKAAKPLNLVKKQPEVIAEASDVEASAVEQTKAPAKVKAPKGSAKISKAKAARERLATEETKKWSDLKEKYSSEKASPYSMSAVFESNRPLQHKVLGWGWIVAVQNDRLEVLFEDGTKMLISNYKPR